MSTPPSLPSSADGTKQLQARWFAEKVQSHEPALRAWLRSEYPTISDVDDIVQESYLRLLRSKRLSEVESAKPYLFGIARNVVFSIFRRRRRFAERSIDSLVLQPEAVVECDAGDRLSAQQELALAVDAIKTLPVRCQEIVMLRALHGLSYSDIATKLGLAEGTVRVQMARGVRKCAEFLRKRGMDERSETTRGQ